MISRVCLDKHSKVQFLEAKTFYGGFNSSDIFKKGVLGL